MSIKTNFLSYIKKSIEFKALDFKKQYYKLKKSECSLGTNNIILENKNAFLDYMPYTDSPVEDKDIIDFFDNFIKRDTLKKSKNLTLLQKKIIYKIYIEDLNERIVAEQLNTSYQNINNIKRKALKKLNLYYRYN